MTKPVYELAVIIRTYKHDFIQKHQPHYNSMRVLHALEICRTVALGGHADGCDSCGHLRISYNSCRNRHCPKCQSSSREQWILKRQADLLPVSYFHVVFTIPEQLHSFCLHHPEALYNILFAASKQTIETFAADPKHLGAGTGMIGVLHTWGQNLSLHPHIHYIVPGGGISKAGFWKPAKHKGQFLFPVESMSIVFKNKFMEALRAFLIGIQQPLDIKLRQLLYQKQWVVYAKQPFGGPEQVIEYLGRYSHKIAISNHRIKEIGDHKITFQYKDYAKGGAQKLMTLDAAEFLRRFCLHILPRGFRKIRHYGILSSRYKPKLRIRQLQMGVLPRLKMNPIAVGWKEIARTKLNYDAQACPCCKTGKMIRLMSFEANAPPTISMMTAQMHLVMNAK